MLARLPNVLTAARMVAIAPFAILLASATDGVSWQAAVIFAAAAFTDFLDGYVARHAHAQSRFGRLVDPLADRLLIDVAVVLMAYHDRLSWWLAAPLLLRDAALVATLRSRPFRTDMEVNLVGKSATAAIMTALALLMLTRSSWPIALYALGLGLSVAAAALYVNARQGGLESKPS
jgi:cardiolipin synthase (CMP-forming)